VAYCTAAYFIRNYDNRQLQQNLSDTGTPVSADDLTTNTTLLQLLEEASEMIAAAVEVGKRYTPAQLTALAALESGGYLLKRLTGDLAYGLLMSRRGRAAADVQRLAPMYGYALQTLEQLRTGAHLFPGVPDGTHPEAGLPDVADLNSSTQTARITTFTSTARRMFPFSCDRQPNPRNDNCCG
jgi:hypothetical protein